MHNLYWMCSTEGQTLSRTCSVSWKITSKSGKAFKKSQKSQKKNLDILWNPKNLVHVFWSCLSLVFDFYTSTMTQKSRPRFLKLFVPGVRLLHLNDDSKISSTFFEVVCPWCSTSTPQRWLENLVHVFWSCLSLVFDFYTSTMTRKSRPRFLKLFVPGVRLLHLNDDSKISSTLFEVVCPWCSTSTPQRWLENLVHVFWSCLSLVFDFSTPQRWLENLVHVFWSCLSLVFDLYTSTVFDDSKILQQWLENLVHVFWSCLSLVFDLYTSTMTRKSFNNISIPNARTDKIDSFVCDENRHRHFGTFTLRDLDRLW